MVELSRGIHHSIDITFLGLAGLIVGLLVLELSGLDRLRTFRAVVSVLTGVVSAGYAIRYLSTVGVGKIDVFMPGLGWLGAASGGSLLITVGAYYLICALNDV